MSKITIESEELDITISTKADLTQGQLQEAAIVYLIEEQDTHFEEKTGNEDAASQFYASILSAVARHFAVDGYPDDEYESPHEVLQLLIGLLHDKDLI